jgi:hypothetical protein
MHGPPTNPAASVVFGEYYRFDLENPANGGVLKTSPVSNCASGEFRLNFINQT